MLDKLPSDLAVEIGSRVMKTTTSHPMDDLAALRASCKTMKEACGAAVVGWRIVLNEVLERHSWPEPYYYSREYRSNLILRLAAIGHPEACFKAGMSAVFFEDRGKTTPRLDMLERANEFGHKLATYVLALVLYRLNAGADCDAKALWLLRQIEGDEESGPPAVKNAMWKNPVCADCRHRAYDALHDDAVVPDVARPLPRRARHLERQDEHQCRARGCGNVATDRWSGWEQWGWFCNEECRIRNECSKLFDWKWA